MKVYACIRLIGLIMIGTTSISAADEILFSDKNPSVDQIIEVLSPYGKPRSFGPMRPLPKYTQRKISAKSSLSMPILFTVNSADLSQSAQNQLNTIGQALRSNQLNRLNFVIEGHTDAQGNDEYNQWLSEQRASSVVNYLTQAFDIDPTRLQAVGKGKADLFDQKHPYSSTNRRVRIVTDK